MQVGVDHLSGMLIVKYAISFTLEPGEPMAKATNKSPKTNPVEKPAKAKKPAKSAIERSNERERDQIYEENKEAIDTALKLCCSHFNKKGMTERVALEAIRRLKDYYLRHGIKPGHQGSIIG